MANTEKTQKITFKEEIRVLLLDSLKQYAGNNTHFFDSHSVNLLNYIDSTLKRCADAGVDYEKDLEAQSKLRVIFGLIYSMYFSSLVDENEYGVNSDVKISDKIDELLLTNFNIKKDTVRKPVN